MMLQKKGRELDFGGQDEGFFWISYNDFYLHFSEIYVCQVFSGKKWKKLSYDGSWAISTHTAGGSYENQTYHENPQCKMTVSGKQAVEVFLTLDTTEELSSSFFILDHLGKKV